MTSALSLHAVLARILQNLDQVGGCEALNRVLAGFVGPDVVPEGGVLKHVFGEADASALIAGGLTTNGAGITPLELHGAADSLQITEGLTAAGGDF